MTKYSSYKKHQLITENWRKFMNEETSPWEKALDTAAKKQLQIIAQDKRVQLAGSDVHLQIEAVMSRLIGSLLSGEIAPERAMEMYSEALDTIKGLKVPPPGDAMWNLDGPQQLMYVAGELVDIAAWARRNIEERGYEPDHAQKSMEKVRPRKWGQDEFHV